MARFCTQCGSQVSEEVRFCPRCGTPMTNPSAGPASPASYPAVQSTAPVSTAPVVQAAPAGASVLPPAGKPSPVLKIILIVLGVFVLLGVLGIASCLVIAHRVRQQIRVNEARNGGSISIGDLKIGSRDNSAAPIAGVPVYPGARPLENGAQVTFGNAGVAVQQYETDDPVDKVLAFYKEHLGDGASVVTNGGHYQIGITKSAGDTSSTTNIEIETDSQNGKTKITVTHVGK